MENLDAAIDRLKAAADSVGEAARAHAVEIAAAGHAASGGAVNPFVYQFAIFAMAVFVGYSDVNRLAATASALYARNLYAFVETLIDKSAKSIVVKPEDELVKATCLTRGGAVVHPNFQPKAA